MREEDVRDAARVLEPLHELSRVARRIYEQVTASARSEVRVRAERRPRVEPAAPHGVGNLLGKDDALRPRLFSFAAYGRGRTHEYRSPCREPLPLRIRLARKDAFAVALDDEIRRDVPRRAAIDARRVDVPVARS